MSQLAHVTLQLVDDNYLRESSSNELESHRYFVTPKLSGPQLNVFVRFQQFQPELPCLPTTFSTPHSGTTSHRFSVFILSRVSLLSWWGHGTILVEVGLWRNEWPRKDYRSSYILRLLQCGHPKSKLATISTHTLHYRNPQI